MKSVFFIVVKIIKKGLSITNVSVKVKPRANGRNIFGQQLPTLLDATCCVRCMLLLVVGSCCAKFEIAQTFRQVETDTTNPNIVGQQYWELSRPFASSLRSKTIVQITIE